MDFWKEWGRAPVGSLEVFENSNGAFLLKARRFYTPRRAGYLQAKEIDCSLSFDEAEFLTDAIPLC
jgi:hypothetical protein